MKEEEKMNLKVGDVIIYHKDYVSSVFKLHFRKVRGNNDV